jgi:predicted AAA+ superfamily ATPase
MVALAINLSQAVSYKVLAQDMALGDKPNGPSIPTVDAYLGILKQLFLVEDLTGWEPPLVSRRRVRTKPKRYYTDPSLPAALLGATPSNLTRDMQTLGRLFEALCLRDLNVYLSALPGFGNRLQYYRDANGLEVDAIVQTGDGRCGAFEMKLSDSRLDEAASNLTRMAAKVTSNAAAQSLSPEFLAVLVGKGDIAYRRRDGVLVTPLATLAP